jgi:hypothetical protein
MVVHREAVSKSKWQFAVDSIGLHSNWLFLIIEIRNAIWRSVISYEILEAKLCGAAPIECAVRRKHSAAKQMSLVEND